MSTIESTDELIARIRREDAEKVARGENCSRCGAWIFTLGEYPGHPRECYACKKIHDGGEVDHAKYLRCPKCRHAWDPYETENYEVFSEDVHDVTCPECRHDFEITTTVSYSFTSPEMEPEDEGGGEGDEGERDDD